MNLYHYRSVESARKEIECRTFRYADRNELNDPLEGYAQIYWKGDCPAWEGLFRNYICSVYYAVVGIQLNASEELWQRGQLFRIFTALMMFRWGRSGKNYRIVLYRQHWCRS